MIQFSLVDPELWREAYQWHRGFVASNDLVFPRTMDAYEALAKEGQIWCARDDRGDYLALAYYHFEDGSWEVGGLMVATSQREKGLGSIITCLTLGHVLFENDPLARGVPVIAHVHAQNKPGPRPIFEKLLKFSFVRSVRVEGKRLPGLQTNAEGFVEGDEFHLVRPDTLKALASWCRTWNGRLKDGHPTDVTLGPELSLGTWADAFDDMASR